MTSYTKSMMESLAEVRGLQEDNMDLMRKAAGGAMQTLKMKDGKLKMDSFTASAIMQIFDKVNPANKKKMEQMINDGKKSGIIKLQKFAMSKVNAEYSEELELDEGREKSGRQLVDPKREVMVVKKNKVIVIDKKDEDKYLKQGWELAEEVDLDEGKMKELHMYISQGKSAEWIAKKMGLDVKTIKSLMSDFKEAYELGTNEYREYLEKLTPGEMDEASARADAKRAMRADPSMKQDPFSKDDEASDDDVKGASKNIIMQMRKAVSLRGNFPVEFGDGKKVKIPAKVAQAVQDKYNSFRKPADKEKFQAQVAKSYKDMLKVLKAGYNEEVELDEMSPKDKILKKTADHLQALISGSNLKDDNAAFAAARDYVEAGNLETLATIVKKLDTDPKEAIINAVAKGMGKKEAEKLFKVRITRVEEVELDEAKYELYHKDFSSAMQHAYKMAKKLHGITVDPKEIDDKVASGPRKPSEGKTNTYRLEGDKGAIQVQVYNKGGSKPYELNFYKEEVELDEAKIAFKTKAKDGGYFVVLHRDTSGMKGKQDKFLMRHMKGGKVKDWGSHSSVDGAKKFAVNRGIIDEETILERIDRKLKERKNG